MQYDRTDLTQFLHSVVECVFVLFRKPGVTGRGLYELRPEWNKHFNLYFHHYSRADQSKVRQIDQVIKEVIGGNCWLGY